MAQQARTSVIAITGGMGSGKSSVAAYLCEIGGAMLLSADIICRQLLEPDKPGWLAMQKAFGERFLLPDQTIDRSLLRTVLFEDHGFRRELDALLHPLVRNEIVSSIGKEEARCVVEVPLLYEARWEGDFSRVVVVYAEEAICLQRLMLRDRISEADARKAIATQLPLPQKALLADHVIDNSGLWSETCSQILHLRNVLWDDAEPDRFPSVVSGA